MFEIVQQDLVEILTAEASPGGYLEGVRTVFAGELPRTTPEMPCVAVAWSNRHDVANNGNHVELSARFLIGLYLSSIEGDAAADAQLQHLLCRRENGVWRGLLPRLTRLRGYTNTDHDLAFVCNVESPVLTGSVDSRQHNHFTRAAEIVLRVTHLIPLTQI